MPNHRGKRPSAFTRDIYTKVTPVKWHLLLSVSLTVVSLLKMATFVFYHPAVNVALETCNMVEIILECARHERCHELSPPRKNELSVTLQQQRRKGGGGNF